MLLCMNISETQPVYLWFDMEFTDLDPSRARILQVAALLTDAALQPLDETDRGLNFHVYLDPDAPVSEWVQENLAPLLQMCRTPQAVQPGAVEIMLTRYVDRLVGPAAEDIKARPAMAGNSVHSDWRLASIHYPALIDRLHYRLFDVSTLKQEWEGWWQQGEADKESAEWVQRNLPFEVPVIEGAVHDAYYDVLASIAELNFYRSQLKLAATAET